MRDLIGKMPGQVMLGLILLVALAGYLAGCWWREWKHCRCCKGTGRHYRKDGKAFRDCWWCRRTPGRRVRVGRRVLNRFGKGRRASA